MTKFILFLIVLLSSAGCRIIDHSSEEELFISNRQIKWDGNFLGLSPVEADGNLKDIIKQGKVNNAFLLEALKDKEKFVTAHYLLTRINMKNFKFSSSHWNNLKITLNADGTTDYHPEQMEDIQKFWIEIFKGISKN